MNIKDIIKIKREEKGYSLKELGNLIGVSESTISRWESGIIANMTHTNIVKISKVLDILPEVLLEYDTVNNSISISQNTVKIRDITYNNSNNTANDSKCCENLNIDEKNIDDTIKLQQQDKLIQTEILLMLKELYITNKEILITLKEIKNKIDK